MCLLFSRNIFLGFRAHCFNDESGNCNFLSRHHIQYEIRMNDLFHPIHNALRREEWLAEADRLRMIGLTACIAAGVNYYLKSVALFIAIHWHRVIQRISGMRRAFMAVNFPISPSTVFQYCPVRRPAASVVCAFSIDADAGFRPMDKSITPNGEGYFFPIGIVRRLDVN